LLSIGSVALVLLLLNARMADASIAAFFDYIYEMSGPGKFGGLGVAVEVVCIGELPHVDVRTGEVIRAPEDPTEPSSSLYLYSKCAFLDQRKPNYHIAPSVSFLFTDGNPYTYSPLKQTLRDRVYATPVLLVVDGTIPGLNYDRHQKLFRGVNVGVGAGAIRLSGQQFDPFWKYTIEIPRITLKPAYLFRSPGAAAAVGSSSRADLIQIQFITKIIGSVTPQDFGALPGPKSGTHIGEYVTLSINF
jgi:hypothetical protein